MATDSKESPNQLDRSLERTRELTRAGLDWSQAHGIAWLEERIHQWPEAYGDDLQIVIYGDFYPPKSTLEIPSLGIVVHPEKVENSVIRTAGCVLKATVKVKEKSVPAIIDATRRINVFLGAYTLVNWGNGACGWWSWVTHGTGAGVGTTLAHEELQSVVEGVMKLKPEVRKKVNAALHWIREPRNLLMEFYRKDILRGYSAYWNAFECLVEAVNIVCPRSKLSKSEKQQMINELLARKQGRLTPNDFEECYQTIVNPSFVAKASHALKVCFGSAADAYILDCFKLPEKRNRLYDIRNAINHGDIDAEHSEELIRIESRLQQLWMIVWGMFGRLVPFQAPLDSNLKANT